MHHADRHGAKQPERFDPKKAASLDDLSRFEYLPLSEVAALLDAPKGGLVADFGTGTGLYAIQLAKLRPDLQIVAIDEQEQMLGILQKKLSERTQSNVRPVLSGTPAATGLIGRVDRALALNVLHELGDVAMAELGSLLNRGGRVLFIDWNASAERQVGPPKDHVLSPNEARKRLEGLGWRVSSEKKLFRYHYALTAMPVRAK